MCLLKRCCTQGAGCNILNASDLSLAKKPCCTQMQEAMGFAVLPWQHQPCQLLCVSSNEERGV